MRVRHGSGYDGYGMPGLAYTDGIRRNPITTAALAGFGAMHVNPHCVGGYGELELMNGYGAYGVIATSASIARSRQLIAKYQRELKRKGKNKPDANRRKWLRARIKQEKQRLRDKIAKNKRQVRRRRQKGKKLLGYQKRALKATKRGQKFSKAVRRGLKKDVPPAWFMPNANRADRYNAWKNLSLKQRIKRYERFKAGRGSSGQAGASSGSTVGPMIPGESIISGMNVTGPAPVPVDAFAPRDPYSVSPLSTGYPSAVPAFVEAGPIRRRRRKDDDEEIEDDEETEEIEETGADQSRLLLYGGLAAAALAAVFIFTRKKPGRSGRPT